jgi:hypothetical protein
MTFKGNTRTFIAFRALSPLIRKRSTPDDYVPFKKEPGKNRVSGIISDVEKTLNNLQIFECRTGLYP